jgi:endonuclease/exonuclease/phosphatase family metal-dependent hydrolase
MNLHHGSGIDGRVDLARTANVLRSTGAELFALQELDRNLERSGRKDQPELLSGLLGMPVHFQPTLSRGTGEYGLAVAAESLEEIRYEDLPRLGTEEPRGALIVGWRGFTVMVTHLSLVRRARAAQIRFLAELADGLAPPVLILGDLNSGRLGLRPLTAAGFRGSRGWRPTVEKGWPRRIDHILGGPGATVAGARVVASGASDHRAVVAEVVQTG